MLREESQNLARVRCRVVLRIARAPRGIFRRHGCAASQRAPCGSRMQMQRQGGELASKEVAATVATFRIRARMLPGRAIVELPRVDDRRARRGFPLLADSSHVIPLPLWTAPVTWFAAGRRNRKPSRETPNRIPGNCEFTRCFAVCYCDADGRCAASRAQAETKNESSGRRQQ